MKNILVTGSNGQLGSEISLLKDRYKSFRFFFTDIEELDICNLQAVRRFVKENNIAYIVNCAAYTAVDKAEDDIERCYKVNRDAPENLGSAAREFGAKLIHVSTDYVFDGTNYRPYVESDSVCPASVYGKSKSEGESALMKVCPESIIIRTSWLYSGFGNNFVKTMIRLGKERDALSVVFDQVGTPTNAADLAYSILEISEYSEKNPFRSGIYHFSNEGVCSWYDFTISIHKFAGITGCKISPIEGKDFPAKAPRPHYSVLNKKKIKETFGISIPHWEESLKPVVEGLLNH